MFGASYSYSSIAGASYHRDGIIATKIIERAPNGNTYIQTASYSPYSIGEIRVLSFTTTDGKVHTADNLNY